MNKDWHLNMCKLRLSETGYFLTGDFMSPRGDKNKYFSMKVAGSVEQFIKTLRDSADEIEKMINTGEDK